MWVQHYLACEDLVLDGISVESVVNANNDGIDIDGCRRVRISNCRIRSGDDAIVLKSTSPRPCEQVVITNCTLSSECNAFKCGTESTGGFLDIAVSNCLIHDTRLSGIALEAVDGGILDGVTISNLRMRNVRNAIFLRLGNRARPYLSSGPGGGEGSHRLDPAQEKPGVGALRNVHISQVNAVGGDAIGCALSGLPGHPLENILLEGIQLESAGGGRAVVSVEDYPEKYPEYSMFGPLPGHGFYCRHVRNLTLNGFEVKTLRPDQRPALVLDEIAGLELARWKCQASAGIPSARLRNVRQAWIHGCWPATPDSPFLRLEGAASREIQVGANACRESRSLIEHAEDFPESELLCL
jgi:polygalacturonase